MRGIRRATVIGASLAITVGMVFPLSAAAASDREIAAADHFRRSMGFAAGLDKARQSFTDESKYSVKRWGAPLTPTEAAEMDRRSTERPKVQPAVDYAVTRTTSGGMYFDQKRGAKPVFLFTRETAKHSAVIRDMLPGGIDYDVEKVDYSMSDLLSLQQVITDDMEPLAAEGIPVAQVGASAQRNKVLVGLETASPRAKDILQERYGPMVTTEIIGPTQFDTCNRGNCRPIKGGLKITRFNDQDPIPCTSGFNGRRSNGTHVNLVAGHCLALNGGIGNCGPTWKHNNNTFGCARGHSLPECDPSCPDADADVGWIKIDSNEDNSPRNKVFASSSTDIRSIKGVLGGSDMQEGDVMCRSGAVSKWKCGELKKKCVDKKTSGGWKILCVATLDFDSTSGDSGAPVIRTDNLGPPSHANVYMAAGIHSHSTKDKYCEDNPSKCRSWFTKANRVEQHSPATICTSSSC